MTPKLKTQANRLLTIAHQYSFIKYLVVGGLTFAIDFGLLIGLHGFLDLSVVIAASISYWTSIIFNFFVNRRWTFDAAENNSLHKHAAAYLLLLGFNYLFTVSFIAVTHTFINYAIAKAVAVLIQMSWTYWVHKHLIFVKK